MILDQFKLDDKVAIVTGSAQGLGQGIALGLARISSSSRRTSLHRELGSWEYVRQDRGGALGRPIVSNNVIQTRGVEGRYEMGETLSAPGRFRRIILVTTEDRR